MAVLAGVVGVLIGLASGVGLMAAVQSNDDQAATSRTDTETSSPDQRGESVSVSNLEPGDCILELSLGEATSVDLVDCDQPHDAEVFGVVELGEPRGAPYPGNEDIVNRVNDRCTDVFEDYVGGPPRESELTIDFMYPGGRVVDVR